MRNAIEQFIPIYLKFLQLNRLKFMLFRTVTVIVNDTTILKPTNRSGIWPRVIHRELLTNMVKLSTLNLSLRYTKQI